MTRTTMTRTTRADSAGVRHLVSAAAVAGTLVAWVSLAQVAPADAPAADPATIAPVVSTDPIHGRNAVAAPDVVGVPDVVDVTASASGRARGRR